MCLREREAPVQRVPSLGPTILPCPRLPTWRSSLQAQRGELRDQAAAGSWMAATLERGSRAALLGGLPWGPPW